MKNNVRKILLDTHDCKSVMVAEAEGLSIKYCMTNEAITNLCAKEGEEESTYDRMRKRLLREWPDDTFQETMGTQKRISELRKQLLELKTLYCLSFKLQVKCVLKKNASFLQCKELEMG